MATTTKLLVVVAVVAGGVGLAISVLPRRAEPPRAGHDGGAAADAGPAPSVSDAAIERAQNTTPTSPLGAAVSYGERLERCWRSGGENLALWGRGDRSAGVRLDIAEGGVLLGAKLWGNPGAIRTCIEEELQRWPVAAAGTRVVSVDYPVSRSKFGRHPGGDVQLLVAMHYYREELSVSDLKGSWSAICPRDGGAALVSTSVTSRRAGEDEYVGWSVSATACPGDLILMLRGIETRLEAEAAAASKSPASDAARDQPEDGGVSIVGQDAGAGGTPAVPTALITDLGMPIDSVGLELPLGKARYRISLVAPKPESPLEGAVVVLERGQVAQVLTSGGYDYHLVWAGDVEGDGALDLVIVQNLDVPRYELFLSSKAGARLVRRAAALQRMGD